MKHVAYAHLILGLAWFASIASASEPSVPKPYTPVIATPDTFQCLGRSTDLGSFLLPKQITSAAQPLFAAPIRLTADPDIFANLSGHSTITHQQPDAVTWNWTADSADLRAAATMTGECDGFTWYEIKLEPKHPLAIRSLALELPRTAPTAQYLLTASYDWASISRGLNEIGGKWSGPFVPYLWLGDEERGLAWTAESWQGWHLKDPAHALHVETRGNTVIFRVNFVDHEMTLSEPLIFKFGLQASPVKPVSFAWRSSFRVVHDIHYDSCVPGGNGRCELDDLRDGGAKSVIIHDSWTAYFGQTIPADKSKFHRLIDACHARGLKLLVYIGYGVARNAPELKGHHDQWSVMPLIPWDPGYKPETRGFDATCARGGWADWLVSGINQLFADYNIDGLYFDGTTEAWKCQNAEHGCGWKDDRGQLQPDFPILDARRLMRRIADAVHHHNPDAILDVHMSDNMTLPTLSFCDSAWNGEQFEGYTAAQKFTVPLDAFRTQFMGYAHGMDTEFLCYENRPFTFEEAIALAWLHGVEVRPYPPTLKYVTPIWKAMDRFGITDAAWHPYWKQPLALADNPDTKVSGWQKEHRLLLIVSHLQRSPADVHFRFNDELTQSSSKIRATDALTGESIKTDGSTIPLSFRSMNCRFVDVVY